MEVARLTSGIREGVSSALDNFEYHNTTPSRLIRGRPPQAHLNEQLDELDQLQYACGPLVAAVLLAPGPRIASMWRRGYQRLMLRIRLHNPRQQRIMIETGHIEQGGDYMQ